MIGSPCAMKINGVYLERLIPGYMTLDVGGREEYEDDLKTDSQIFDGIKLIHQRVKERILYVRYRVLLRSYNRTTTREVINTINKQLRTKNSEIIFDDEPDKYYIGTKISNDIEKFSDRVIYGGFQILCEDPYKYAISSKQFKAVIKNGKLVANIGNSGSANAAIDYLIKLKSDVSSIGIASDNGVMQFGTPDNVNTSTASDCETLVHMSDLRNSSYNLANKNPGKTSRLNNLNLNFVEEDYNGWPYSIRLANPEGALATNAGVNGGCWTYTIPADRNNVYGAVNFYCSLNTVFASGLMNQTGEFTIGFLDGNNRVVCGYNFYSLDYSGNSYKYECILNGKVVKTYTLSANAVLNNPLMPSTGYNDILKEGATVRFHCYGQYPKFTDNAIKNVAVKKIQIGFYQASGWGSRLTADEKNGGKTAGEKAAEMYMSACALRNLRFDKYGVSVKETTKKFRSGSSVKIEGSNGKIYIDGKYEPDYECVGTEYFTAHPGYQTIQFQFSPASNNHDVFVYVRDKWR